MFLIMEVYKIMVYYECYVGSFLICSNSIHKMSVLNNIFDVTVCLYVMSGSC